MAVYKRTYKGYEGPLTNPWLRFLILTRYGYSRLFQSRFLTLFMAACLFFPIGCIAYVYVAHNAPFLLLLGIPVSQYVAVDGRFFYIFCYFQGSLAFILTALIGPGLVSPDLTHGAMPLYFCRPLSRTKYVLGKICVLIALLSSITWIPGFLLYVIQGTLEGWDWFTANLWLAWGLFFGMMIWIIVLSLIALAASAWVKWKIAAGAVILGVFFAGAGFGAAINNIMRTTNGSLINLSQVVHTIWAELFAYDSGSEMSMTGAWTVLIVTAALCCWLLAKRIRPFEVVR
jgi:ABC-2 type transport system permease protein